MLQCLITTTRIELYSKYIYFLQILIPESEGPDDVNGVATLTVQRTRNTVGDVTVYWEISEDGRMDLEPSNGNLNFREVHYAHCL